MNHFFILYGCVPRGIMSVFIGNVKKPDRSAGFFPPLLYAPPITRKPSSRKYVIVAQSAGVVECSMKSED